jgi:CubicO group peptidase (beta-lactamase class C family)
MSSFVRAVLGVVLIAAPAHAQITADTAAQIDKVFASLNRTDAPGCVVGLDRNGQALYRRGYGMANLETRVPLDENSVSESGSVAKQFTASAVVYLALHGKLNLDEPVRKYIPELPDYGSPVTIRMLLNHTSGVRDMWTLFTVAGQPLGETLFSMERSLQMVYRQKELNFPPNSQFLYSNSGYLLLSEIVKRVSGVPLDQFSQETFFHPLGMSHTQWRSDWNRVVPGRATAYGPSEGGYRTDMPYMSVYGAGGLLTTVGDLLIWNEQLTHPRVGGQALVDSMQRQGRLTSGREIEYALGLFIGKYRGEPEIQHSGATGGYRTFLARYPERGLSIALLCNVANVNSIALGHQVIDVFMGGKAEVAAKPVAAGDAGSVDPAPYLGRYRAPATEEVMTIAAKDGRLVAAFGPSIPLVPVAKDRFTSSATPIDLAFEVGPSGHATRLRFKSIDGDTVLYEPVTVTPLSAAETVAIEGAYYSEELDATYTVHVRNGELVVRVGDQPERTFPRTGPWSFGRGGTAVRFTQAKNGKINGLLLFAGRVRNLRFVKR